MWPAKIFQKIRFNMRWLFLKPHICTLKLFSGSLIFKAGDKNFKVICKQKKPYRAAKLKVKCMNT